MESAASVTSPFDGHIGPVPSMVGLILTGKSIARFPELKERFAEYFLIGTLLSIGLAVLGGLVLVKLWYGTMSLK